MSFKKGNKEKKTHAIDSSSNFSNKLASGAWASL